MNHILVHTQNLIEDCLARLPFDIFIMTRHEAPRESVARIEHMSNSFNGLPTPKRQYIDTSIRQARACIPLSAHYYRRGRQRMKVRSAPI